MVGYYDGGRSDVHGADHQGDMVMFVVITCSWHGGRRGSLGLDSHTQRTDYTQFVMARPGSKIHEDLFENMSWSSPKYHPQQVNNLGIKLV